MTRPPSSLLQGHLSGPVQAALQAAYLAVRRVVAEAEAPQVPVVIRFQGHLPALLKGTTTDGLGKFDEIWTWATFTGTGMMGENRTAIEMDYIHTYMHACITLHYITVHYITLH